MNGRAMVGAGAVGAIVAAICCATPALAVLLPLVGLGAWLVKADFVVFPLFVVSLGLIGVGLYRRRGAAAPCGAEPAERGVKP
jgi:mercuric ion transport protein